MRSMLIAALVFVPALHGEDPPKAKAPEVKDGWMVLFDGKNLDPWKSTGFVNGGSVDVKDGAIRIAAGQPMTGVVYKGAKLPNNDYEISWEAKRTQGHDFFCAMTFPVKDSPCSFVVSGWGGNVSGLSSLNGADASENPTTTSVRIENDKWYKMRVRTTDKKIEAWVDDEQVVEIDPSEFTFSVRIEVDRCRPFGFASYRSTGLIRNIRLKNLAAERGGKPK